MVRRVAVPRNAAALPEIMARALRESKFNVPVQFKEGRAAGQQPRGAAGAGERDAPKGHTIVRDATVRPRFNRRSREGNQKLH